MDTMTMQTKLRSYLPDAFYVNIKQGKNHSAKIQFAFCFSIKGKALMESISVSTKNKKGFLESLDQAWVHEANQSLLHYYALTQELTHINTCDYIDILGNAELPVSKNGLTLVFYDRAKSEEKKIIGTHFIKKLSELAALNLEELYIRLLSEHEYKEASVKFKKTTAKSASFRDFLDGIKQFARKTGIALKITETYLYVKGIIDVKYDFLQNVELLNCGSVLYRDILNTIQTLSEATLFLDEQMQALNYRDGSKIVCRYTRDYKGSQLILKQNKRLGIIPLNENLFFENAGLPLYHMDSDSFKRNLLHTITYTLTYLNTNTETMMKHSFTF